MAEVIDPRVVVAEQTPIDGAPITNLLGTVAGDALIMAVTDRHVVLPEKPPATAAATINGVENGDGGALEESVYFDENEGNKNKSIIEGNVYVPELITSVLNDQNLGDLKDKILSGLNASTSKSPQKEIVTIENAGKESDDDDDEEEVVELEFERAVDKLHSHTPYCPNCSHQITKVVLRRKKPRGKARKDPVDLLGCLSCFSIFIPSGDCLNPFRIFGGNGKEPSVTTPERKPERGVKGAETSCNIFGWFRAIQRNREPSAPSHITDRSPPTEPGATSIGAGLLPSAGEGKLSGATSEPVESAPSGDVTIDFPDETGSIDVAEHSTSVEIVKCIVYGGLMELIASLSVVSSAAAADATTLNIICIGLATMFSSLIAFGNNLLDLKKDIPRESSEQQVDQYEEQLGKRDNFLLHSSLATLSFLIFGLIPPIVYGFAFKETNNKDYTMLVVAIVSFVCILVLAAAKAYVQRAQTMSDYVKTIMYYATLSIGASGVAYAAGDLIEMLIDRFGWFAPSTTPAGLLGPGMVSGTRAWGSY
ncbi:membrane protein of ER body 2-like isoform X2 [Andrographis paniculata]|uniref:membrane protein of ER body 2-like isoform X2 n=1 Tax=Andrographis paniculata TaxID=175694 RepID=UPI0021E7DA7C|nr:membrane protein of ER body 2-like isoform X2 [Andrographis paniculata]